MRTVDSYGGPIKLRGGVYDYDGSSSYYDGIVRDLRPHHLALVTRFRSDLFLGDAAHRLAQPEAYKSARPREFEERAT